MHAGFAQCHVSFVKAERTCEDILEGEFYVAGVQGGCFNEGQVVIACG